MYLSMKPALKTSLIADFSRYPVLHQLRPVQSLAASLDYVPEVALHGSQYSVLGMHDIAFIGR